MSISHRKAFELFHQGMHTRLQFGAADLRTDRIQAEALAGLEPEQRAELQTHWEDCPECKQDLVLSVNLRQEALQRWPLTVTPKYSASEILQTIQNRQHVSNRLLAPLRLALMVALLLGGILALSWIINTVRPRPSGSTLPTSTLQPTWTPRPSPTQTVSQPIFTKTQLKPLILGGVFEMSYWSSDGRFLLIIKTDPSPDVNSDRIYSSLHFFDAQNGQVCQSGETLLGTQFEQGSLGWLPDGKVLVTSQSDISIYTPCSPQVEDISALFTDQIQAVRKPHKTSDYLVLTGEQAFWIFEPVSRNVLEINGLVPSQSGRDHIFSSPSGGAIAISQAAETGSLISLVDLHNGQILEKINVPVGSEQFSAWLEWMLEDVILVYGEPNLGSVLVERQPDGSVRMTPVLEDLFGLDLLSPNEITAQGGYGDPQRGIYYLTLVTRSPQERALYIYHSDGDRVEELPHDFDTFLFFPNGETENMFRLEDTPTFTDLLQLVWIDHPTRQNQQLTALGHTPRQYPQITHAWDPGTQRMAFGSTQGVSLVSIADGRLIEFWSLEGAQDSGYTNLSLSPDGKTLAVQAMLARSTQFGPPESAFYVITLPP
jgi:WD40 repeat protein